MNRISSQFKAVILSNIHLDLLDHQHSEGMSKTT